MTKTTNAKAPEPTATEATSKIEAIKNLIFGENMAAYDTEFETLKKDLNEKRKELEDFIEETKKDLHQTIDNLSTDLNIRITDLEDQLNQKASKLNSKKVDKKILGELLISLGEKISQ